jgi:hypothetical protein
MKFWKYFTIAFISANIPWIGWGVIFGWPAILMISIALTYIDSKLELTRLEMAASTLLIGFVSNSITFTVWNLMAHEPLENALFGLNIIALPSIFIGTALTTIFYRAKFKYEKVRKND